MKITFLGIGHGFPEKGRQKSATMLEINGKYYFVDAGADLAQEIVDRELDRSKLKALFVTHMHADHLWGGFGLFCCINEYKRAWGNTVLDVVLPEERAIAISKQLLLGEVRTIAYDRLHFHDLFCDPQYQDENVKLTAVPTDHTNGQLKAWAFIIEAEGKKLLFTGDMHADLHDFPTAALGNEQFDLVVCEYAHSRAEFADPVVPKINTKRLYFNHIGHPYAVKLADIERWAKECPETDIRALMQDGIEIKL